MRHYDMIPEVTSVRLHNRKELNCKHHRSKAISLPTQKGSRYPDTLPIYRENSLEYQEGGAREDKQTMGKWTKKAPESRSCFLLPNLVIWTMRNLVPTTNGWTHVRRGSNNRSPLKCLCVIQNLINKHIYKKMGATSDDWADRHNLLMQDRSNS